MLAWILIVTLFVYQVVGEGTIAALTALASALGVDVVAAVIVGTSVSEIFTFAGIADDLIMAMVKKNITLTEKVFLSVLLESAKHVTEEAHEWYTHTDYENEQFARYLAREYPGQTFLFGDVTPRNLFDLGISAGFIAKKGTIQTVFYALKDKFGGLSTATSDVISIGGGV